MDYQIESFRQTDWAQVRAIYGEGLATGLAAFTSTPPTWRQWDANHLSTGRLVARMANARVGGWAALAPVPDN